MKYDSLMSCIFVLRAHEKALALASAFFVKFVPGERVTILRGRVNLSAA